MSERPRAIPRYKVALPRDRFRSDIVMTLTKQLLKLNFDKVRILWLTVKHVSLIISPNIRSPVKNKLLCMHVMTL